MSTLSILVITNLPLLTWIFVVAFHYPIVKKWGYPQSIKNNPLILKLVPVLFYGLLLTVLAVYMVAPLQARIIGICLAIPSLLVTYLSYKMIFRHSGSTTLDKALIVIDFARISAIMIPVGYLLVYFIEH